LFSSLLSDLSRKVGASFPNALQNSFIFVFNRLRHLPIEDRGFRLKNYRPVG